MELAHHSMLSKFSLYRQVIPEDIGMGFMTIQMQDHQSCWALVLYKKAWLEIGAKIHPKGVQ